MCLKLELKSTKNMRKMEKHCFLMLTYLFYKDSMSNKETFMVAIIIHNLQELYIHYGIYMVTRRLWILLLFLFLFYRICLLKREIMKGYLQEIFLQLSFLFLRAYIRPNNGRNFSIQDSILQAKKDD
jgi:hypothetical protein